jgi:hypothetical protein
MQTEDIKQQAKEIFKAENLAAITYFLYEFVDLRTKRALDTEYQTIIAAAKSDAKLEMIEDIIKKINN